MGSNENDMEGRSAGFNLKMAGAIFIANRKTKDECYYRKLFGLPQSQAGFVRKIKCGMFLFLFEYEERKLFGVFEATSNGALNIMPGAFTSLGKTFPAQIYFKRICCCKPLPEEEFRVAIEENYFEPFKFNCSLSHEQVVKLLYLFVSNSTSVPDSHIHQLWRKLENDSDKSEIAASRNKSIGIDAHKRGGAYDLEFRRRDSSSDRDITCPVSSGYPRLTYEDHIAEMEHEQGFHTRFPPAPWTHIANADYWSRYEPYLRRTIPHGSYPRARSRGVYPNYRNYERVPRAVFKEPSVALGVSEIETSLRHKLSNKKRLMVNRGPSFGNNYYQPLPGIESIKRRLHIYLPSPVGPTCQGNCSEASRQVFDPCTTNSTVSSDCPSSTQSQSLLAKIDILSNDGLDQLPSARNPATPFSDGESLGNHCDYDYIPLDEDDESLPHCTGDSQLLSNQYPEPLHTGKGHFSESEDDDDHGNLIPFYRSHAHGHSLSSPAKPSFYSDGLERRSSVFSRLSKANTSADVPNPSLRQSFLDTFEGSVPMPKFPPKQPPLRNNNEDELHREYGTDELAEPFDVNEPEQYDIDEPEPYGAAVNDGLPFLNFKRKSESRSSGCRTKDDGGAAQDEKPKRRRLVRPSFSEEAPANVGADASGSIQSVADVELPMESVEGTVIAEPGKLQEAKADEECGCIIDAVADVEPPVEPGKQQEAKGAIATTDEEYGCIISDATADVEPPVEPGEQQGQGCDCHDRWRMWVH